MSDVCVCVVKVNFDVVGSLYALMATLALSLQSIFSKLIYKTDKFDQYNLQFFTMCASCIIFFPVWVLEEGCVLLRSALVVVVVAAALPQQFIMCVCVCVYVCVRG